MYCEHQRGTPPVEGGIIVEPFDERGVCSLEDAPTTKCNGWKPCTKCGGTDASCDLCEGVGRVKRWQECFNSKQRITNEMQDFYPKSGPDSKRELKQYFTRCACPRRSPHSTHRKAPFTLSTAHIAMPPLLSLSL